MYYVLSHGVYNFIFYDNGDSVYYYNKGKWEYEDSSRTYKFKDLPHITGEEFYILKDLI